MPRSETWRDSPGIHSAYDPYTFPHVEELAARLGRPIMASDIREDGTAHLACRRFVAGYWGSNTFLLKIRRIVKTYHDIPKNMGEVARTLNYLVKEYKEWHGTRSIPEHTRPASDPMFSGKTPSMRDLADLIEERGTNKPGPG